MRLSTIYNASPFHTSGNLFYHNNLYGSSSNEGGTIPIPSSSNMVFNNASTRELSNNIVWNDEAIQADSNDGVWNDGATP
jgi:hypothetical protein